MKIRIPGDPVGKGRPRFSRSGFARTPEKTRKWEARAAYIARAAWSGPMLEGAICATIEVVHKRPKRLHRRKDPAERLPNHTAQTDLDNCIKAALDALQGICFRNDNQVFQIVARQWYAGKEEEPCVEVTLETFQEPYDPEGTI